MSPPLPPRPTPAVARDPLPLTDEDEDVPDAEAEAQLSDQQVQDLYDNEEIDHFFSLFSAVRLTTVLLAKLLSGCSDSALRRSESRTHQLQETHPS